MALRVSGGGMRAIALVVIAALGVMGWSLWPGTGVDQPIQFPHKTHAGDLKLPCTTCHQRAEKDAVAGRPPAALCLACHATDSNNPEIQKLQSFRDRGEIPWKRVWRLPSHVRFPHRVHVAGAKIRCQACHGPMETLTRPPSHPLKTLAMADCIDCHQHSTVTTNDAGGVTKVAARRPSTDCAACHR